MFETSFNNDISLTSIVFDPTKSRININSKTNLDISAGPEFLKKKFRLDDRSEEKLIKDFK